MTFHKSELVVHLNNPNSKGSCWPNMVDAPVPIMHSPTALQVESHELQLAPSQFLDSTHEYVPVLESYINPRRHSEETEQGTSNAGSAEAATNCFCAWQGPQEGQENVIFPNRNVKFAKLCHCVPKNKNFTIEHHNHA